MFDVTTVFTILFLIFLEGILSMDNALVLAIMVKPLPKDEQRRALTYGIWGAFLFRFISLFLLNYLMHMTWVKLIGGVYLIFIACKNLYWRDEEDEGLEKKGSILCTSPFWKIVLMVELMDIAFSVDSILAAVSLTQNYFVVLAGGILGICMMRYAATLFIKLLDWFPSLEKTAYILVAIIGTKLLIEGMDFDFIDFNSSKNMAPWLFWVAMGASIFYGFKKKAPDPFLRWRNAK